MTGRDATDEAWTSHGERGHVAAIRLMVWIALRLGRPAARLLLYPICGYFLIFSKASRAASGDYLSRVLGRQPRLADRFRHYHAFAACVLDRVYLLNNQIDLFDLHVEGEEIALSSLAQGKGSFLFSAHLGSFEILRALAERHPGLKLSLLMYEENARKINSVLDAINPSHALDIITLGHTDSMLAVEDRLNRGHCIGVLADRGLPTGDNGQVMVDFLGKPARFPLGPFRLAAVLGRPVIFIVGLYRGGRHYDVHFEPLADFTSSQRNTRPENVEQAVRRYAGRIEHFCARAPYNWFNFYDFWK